MTEKAFQDYYPDDVAHCYGCGHLNEKGLRIKSYWDGDETVCRYRPRAEHTAIPGYVYGGLIASLIDCHATGSAAAAKYREEDRPMDSDPPVRFLTAVLNVEFLKPTPIDAELELRGRIVEIKGRKVVVEIDLTANDELCARGHVVTVQAPERLMTELLSP